MIGKSQDTQPPLFSDPHFFPWFDASRPSSRLYHLLLNTDALFSLEMNLSFYFQVPNGRLSRHDYRQASKMPPNADGPHLPFKYACVLLNVLSSSFCLTLRACVFQALFVFPS